MESVEKKRTFKIDIVVVFSLLLMSTFSTIIGFTFYKNRQSTLDIAVTNFEKSAITVIDKTIGYMRAAQILSELSVRIFEDPDMELKLDSRVEQYLLEVVQLQSQIGLFYYGDEKGDFMQASNFNNEIITKHMDRSGGKLETNLKYLDEDLNLIKQAHKLEDYDHRLRPWYLGAKKSGNTYWTDSYIFFESGKPGITVASPVYNNDKSLKGVVAADITLGGLSKILKNMNFSQNGISFIIDESGRFVAFPDANKMMSYEDGELRRLRPHELELPFLTKAVRQYEDKKESLLFLEAEGKKYITYFSSFPDDFGKKWYMGIIAPEDDFLGSLKQTTYLSLVLSLIILVISIGVGIILARKISKPIESLTQNVLNIKNFEFEKKNPIRSTIREISQMSSAIEGMKSGLKAFQLYVPSTLVKQLLDSGEDVSIGGKDRELTIFFSDIVGFTTISENLPPQELSIQLSEYFDQVCGIIAEEKGTLDKYIGDAVMAFWGAPIINDEHAVLTCKAALRCKKAIKKLNDEWLSNEKRPFYTRIGIATGHVIVGNMGSKERMNYTVIGDTVNLSSRLEGVNTFYGTEIIIAQSTYRYVQNHFICRILDQIAVKGKTQSEVIYELLIEKGAEGAEDQEYLSRKFKQAYDLYENREWLKAKDLLKQILEVFPHDQVSKIYIERCDRYISSEPDESWTPITVMTSK